MSGNVFECGICYNTYNEKTHRPLSLPCGHVFCEICLQKCSFLRPSIHTHTPTSHSSSNTNQIQNILPSNPNTANSNSNHNSFSISNNLNSNRDPVNSSASTPTDASVSSTPILTPQNSTNEQKAIICPADNRVHYVTVSKLPVCFTILSYLPNKNETSSIPDHLHCLRHPKKKVKFFCESHNQFLCTSCVIQHTGVGHVVSNFTVNAEKMKNDFGDVKNKFEETYQEALKSKENIELNEKKLLDFYNCQLNKLNMSMDSAIKIINEKRKNFIEILKQSLNEQKRRLDHNKYNQVRKVNRLEESCRNLGEYENSLEQTFYEDFYKLMIEKTNELKSVNELHPQKNTQLIYAFFKDSIKLSDLGSIQYFNNINEISTSAGAGNPDLNPSSSDYVSKKEKQIISTFDNSYISLNQKNVIGKETPKKPWKKIYEDSENIKPIEMEKPQENLFQEKNKLLSTTKKKDNSRYSNPADKENEYHYEKLQFEKYDKFADSKLSDSNLSSDPKKDLRNLKKAVSEILHYKSNTEKNSKNEQSTYTEWLCKKCYTSNLENTKDCSFCHNANPSLAQPTSKYSSTCSTKQGNTADIKNLITNINTILNTSSSNSNSNSNPQTHTNTSTEQRHMKKESDLHDLTKDTTDLSKISKLSSTHCHRNNTNNNYDLNRPKHTDNHSLENKLHPYIHVNKSPYKDISLLTSELNQINELKTTTNAYALKHNTVFANNNDPVFYHRQNTQRDTDRERDRDRERDCSDLQSQINDFSLSNNRNKINAKHAHQFLNMKSGTSNLAEILNQNNSNLNSNYEVLETSAMTAREHHSKYNDLRKENKRHYERFHEFPLEGKRREKSERIHSKEKRNEKSKNMKRKYGRREFNIFEANILNGNLVDEKRRGHDKHDKHDRHDKHEKHDKCEKHDKHDKYDKYDKSEKQEKYEKHEGFVNERKLSSTGVTHTTANSNYNSNNRSTSTNNKNSKHERQRNYYNNCGHLHNLNQNIHKPKPRMPKNKHCSKKHPDRKRNLSV